MNLVPLSRPRVVIAPARKRLDAALMQRITDAGLSVEVVDEGRYRVAGRFEFWPATGWWKETDGKRCGYEARRLIQAAR
jgi:hypothetical protein